ncbi:MAG: hypothetical protein ACOC4E_01040 [Patescibacteria group bacterium]
MFANATHVGFAQRVVATLVACAVVLWSLGAYATAQAANLSNVSNTLTDSDPSVTSAHTIAFTIPASGGSAIGTGDTVTITFPADFTGIGSVGGGNTSVTTDGTPEASPTIDNSGQDVTITNISASPGDEVVVAIDDGVITNPGTPGSYEFEIDSGAGDSGKTRVAILDNVVVSAIVDTEFTFTVSGLATSTPINGTSTTGSTTPTEIPFGTLVADEIKTLAQRLNVTTNANNGFVVTVESDGDLQSSNGAIIDNFADGTDVADTGTAWTAPAEEVDDRTTWGHWGITSNDSDLNSLGGFYSGEFGTDDFIAASTSPREVFHHDGPSDGSSDDLGQVDLGFQIQITPLQEAADDYTTTLTYIATPTF